MRRWVHFFSKRTGNQVLHPQAYKTIIIYETGTNYVQNYVFCVIKVKAVPLHTMGCGGGEEVYLLLVLDLGTRWGWVVSVTPRPRFYPGESTHGTHWIEGWVGLRAGLDAEAGGKLLCPSRGSKPGCPVRCCQTLHWLNYPSSYSVWYDMKNQTNIILIFVLNMRRETLICNVMIYVVFVNCL
jgi:hypothetical protein